MTTKTFPRLRIVVPQTWIPLYPQTFPDGPVQSHTSARPSRPSIDLDRFFASQRPGPHTALSVSTVSTPPASSSSASASASSAASPSPYYPHAGPDIADATAWYDRPPDFARRSRPWPSSLYALGNYHLRSPRTPAVRQGARRRPARPPPVHVHPRLSAATFGSCATAETEPAKGMSGTATTNSDLCLAALFFRPPIPSPSTSPARTPTPPLTGGTTGMGWDRNRNRGGEDDDEDEHDGPEYEHSPMPITPRDRAGEAVLHSFSAPILDVVFDWEAGGAGSRGLMGSRAGLLAERDRGGMPCSLDEARDEAKSTPEGERAAAGAGAEAEACELQASRPGPETCKDKLSAHFDPTPRPVPNLELEQRSLRRYTTGLEAEYLASPLPHSALASPRSARSPRSYRRTPASLDLPASTVTPFLRLQPLHPLLLPQPHELNRTARAHTFAADRKARSEICIGLRALWAVGMMERLEGGAERMMWVMVSAGVGGNDRDGQCRRSGIGRREVWSEEKRYRASSPDAYSER